MNKIAIIFRGHHYRHFTTKGGDLVNFDYTNNINNLYKNIINPFSESYYIDIYLHTFHSPIENILNEHFTPYKLKIIDENVQTQPNNLLDAISMIDNSHQYVKIMILRFDLEFKQKITNFSTDTYGIYFTFYEGCISRVDDLIYIISGNEKILDGFKNGLIKMIQMTNYTCMHYLKDYIEENIPIFILLNDRFYGSDTASTNILANNPLFKLHSRPFYFDN
jgi:hypothetical protein